MNVLILGDFHGEFPRKLLSIAKRKDIDLIISPGDFSGNKEYIKLFFKYSYGTGEDLAEHIGKKRLEKFENSMVDSGLNMLSKLNKLNKMVIAVTGNQDSAGQPEPGLRIPIDKYVKKFRKGIKKLKNVKIIDFKSYNFKGYTFVGYPRSTYPGMVPTKRLKSLKQRAKKDKSLKLKITRITEDNRNFYNKLSKKFNKNTIFISHNCPYNTKLDKLGQGPQKGKHYGSFLTKKLIVNKHPLLAICGHIHERRGIIKLGKTYVVNAGAANEGKAAIVILDDKKKKVKSIKLLR